MIVCSRCGFQNEDSDTFCGSCASFLEWEGQKVQAEAPAPEPEPEPEPEPDAHHGIIERVKEVIGLGDDSSNGVASGVGQDGASLVGREEAVPEPEAEEEVLTPGAVSAPVVGGALSGVAGAGAAGAGAGAAGGATADPPTETMTAVDGPAGGLATEPATEPATGPVAGPPVTVPPATVPPATGSVAAPPGPAAAPPGSGPASGPATVPPAAAPPVTGPAASPSSTAPPVPAGPSGSGTTGRGPGLVASGGLQRTTAPSPAGPAPVGGPVPPAAAAAPKAAGLVQPQASPVKPEAGPVKPDTSSVQPGPVAPAPVQPQAVKPTAVKARPPVKKAPSVREINPGDKVCGQCGEGNDPVRKFCRRCGASLVEATVFKLPWYRALWRRITQRKQKQAGARPKLRRRAFGGSGGWLTSWVTRLIVVAIVVFVVLSFVGPYHKTLKRRETRYYHNVVNLVHPTFNQYFAHAATASTSASGHPAIQAVDGEKNTSWQTNGKTTGQYLVVNFPSKVNIAKVGFDIGDQDTPQSFQTEPRPAQVEFLFEGDQRLTRVIHLKDVSGFQTFNVTTKGSTAFTMFIQSVYPATGTGQNVSVAELEFFTKS